MAPTVITTQRTLQYNAIPGGTQSMAMPIGVIQKMLMYVEYNIAVGTGGAIAASTSFQQIVQRLNAIRRTDSETLFDLRDSQLQLACQLAAGFYGKAAAYDPTPVSGQSQVAWYHLHGPIVSDGGTLSLSISTSTPTSGYTIGTGATLSVQVSFQFIMAPEALSLTGKKVVNRFNAVATSMNIPMPAGRIAAVALISGTGSIDKIVGQNGTAATLSNVQLGSGTTYIVPGLLLAEYNFWLNVAHGVGDSIATDSAGMVNFMLIYPPVGAYVSNGQEYLLVQFTSTTGNVAANAIFYLEDVVQG